jgi:hypothetical protein
LINKEFKKNWLKILKFNETRDILEDPELKKEEVRIPLSPITINANILYHYFEILYPKFINDQQNILDIIVSDKKNKIIGSYLYKTKKSGIHETVEPIPNGIIRIKSVNIDSLDEIFNNVQNQIMKEKGIRISSIRLFKKEAIDLINKHCENIEIISLYQFFIRILDLIQKLFEKDLFFIYPEPTVFNFLKGSLTLLNQVQLKNLFKFIEDLLPKFNTFILLDGDIIKTIIHLQKELSKSGKSNISLKILTLEDLNINLDNLNIKNTLKKIQKKLKTKNGYYLYQKDIISITSDLFELSIPLKKDHIQFLLQKVLFGYRSYENHWSMVPRPILYNNLVRFIIRLFGFNINLKKLSHWAIPDLIFNYIDFYIGLNSRILFIITDLKRSKREKMPQDNLLKDTCKHIFYLEFEESTLKEVKVFNSEELFPDTYFNSLDSIKKIISEKCGAPSTIIVLDKLLLQKIVENFIFRHSKSLFYPRLKTLKMLKNKKYLTIYPEFPPYKLLNKKGTISLLKLILPILIDKHEF